MPLAEHDKSPEDESNILIVDFHPIVRLGLTRLINASQGLRVCGEAETAHETMEAIKVLRPDLVILDIYLKGIHGIKLIEDITRLYPRLLVLVFSKLDESFYAERVLRAGANGYIMKHLPLKKITEAIRCVLAGKIYLSDKIALRLTKKNLAGQSPNYASPLELLSNRELELFRLIGKGYSTKRIGEELCLSIRTVEAYRNHIKEKLMLSSSNELLQHAIQWIQNEG
jgi:DNA-binding NarL/FixJ family response regulator